MYNSQNITWLVTLVILQQNVVSKVYSQEAEGNF